MKNENIDDKIPLFRIITVISSKVRWLLKHGAKVKSDKYGKTPLSDAAENKQLEVKMHFSSFVMLIMFYTFDIQAKLELYKANIFWLNPEEKENMHIWCLMFRCSLCWWATLTRNPNILGKIALMIIAPVRERSDTRLVVEHFYNWTNKYHSNIFWRFL